VIRCLNFRTCAQNTLRGFTFPARSYEGANDLKRFQAVIEFAPGAKRELFQRLAIEAINTFTKQNAEPAS
jgi:hypothetical protein